MNPTFHASSCSRRFSRLANEYQWDLIFFSYSFVWEKWRILKAFVVFCLIAWFCWTQTLRWRSANINKNTWTQKTQRNDFSLQMFLTPILFTQKFQVLPPAPLFMRCTSLGLRWRVHLRAALYNSPSPSASVVPASFGPHAFSHLPFPIFLVPLFMLSFTPVLFTSRCTSLIPSRATFDTHRGATAQIKSSGDPSRPSCLLPRQATKCPLLLLCHGRTSRHRKAERPTYNPSQWPDARFFLTYAFDLQRGGWESKWVWKVGKGGFCLGEEGQIEKKAILVFLRLFGESPILQRENPRRAYKIRSDWGRKCLGNNKWGMNVRNILSHWSCTIDQKRHIHSWTWCRREDSLWSSEQCPTRVVL